MKNIHLTRGLIHSQNVLLALVKKGVTREDAYLIVQKNAMEVWNRDTDFIDLLKSDEDVKKILTDDEIDFQFNLHAVLDDIHIIFDRIGLTA